MRCLSCQNWRISHWPKGVPVDAVEALCPMAAEQDRVLVERSAVTPEAIVTSVQALGCASIAYTYTEPTVFFELALETAKVARAAGLRNVFVTNGFIAPEPLRMIAPYLDAANIDLKGFRESFYKRVCGAPLQPVLDAIRLYKTLGLWIKLTTLLIPGWNDDEAELRELAGFIKTDLGKEVPWHISWFFPAYKMASVPFTPIKTLLQAVRIGRDAGLKFVYLGNVVEEPGEDTRCPACKTPLIHRDEIRMVENRMQDGVCPSCGQPIAGVWT